jgi:drug/metabolite transporter (DMT)-like permease
VARAVGNIDGRAAPPLLSLALVAVSPVIYSVWIVLSARLSGERRSGTGAEQEDASDPTATGAVMLTATAITYWLTAVALNRPVMPAQIPGEAWFGIAGVGLVSTFIAVQAFRAGSHRIGAARASLVSTVEPVWTIVLASLLFHESLTPIQLVGGAMILIGVVIAQTGAGGANRTATELRLADE